jgi:hypothetical protein
MVKLRLTQDCEHGPKGKILDVEDYRVPAFMAEGRVEILEDYARGESGFWAESVVSLTPLVVHPGEEVEIVPQPRQPVEVKVAKPAAKPTKRPRKK